MNLGLIKFLSAVYRAYCALAHPVALAGGEHLPAEGAAILCANHTSLQDPMLLAAYIKRPVRFMAKQELYKYKLLARLMRALGAYPVSRGERDLSAVRASLELLKNGDMIGVFPEGHRFKDGSVHPLQGGVALIAIRSGAPVVPAYISGGYRLFRRMKLTLGAPITLNDIGNLSGSAAIRAATARIQAALCELAPK